MASRICVQDSRPCPQDSSRLPDQHTSSWSQQVRWGDSNHDQEKPDHSREGWGPNAPNVLEPHTQPDPAPPTVTAESGKMKPSGGIGRALLLKMGWQGDGHGLGKTFEGIAEPVESTENWNRWCAA